MLSAGKQMLTRYILGMADHAKRPAFIEQGVFRSRSRSYAETLDRAQAFAAYLRNAGMERRRVIIWARPGADWAVAFYGCVLSGAAAVPIDAGFSVEFVARVKQQIGAALVVTGDTFATFDDLPAARDFQPFPAARDDVAEIVFTSGTTAEPRGVTITHGNLLANLEPVEREIARYRWMAWPFSPIRFVNLIPLSHLFGQVMGLFIPQLLGGTVIFPESQEPAFIAATIRKRRASVMVSVPQQLEILSKWTGIASAPPQGGVLARWWRYRKLHNALGWKMWAFIVGGAALPPDVERQWSALGYAVIQGYGLTETAPAIAITHPFRKTRGGVGINLAGVETRIIENEILVRGPNVSPSAITDSDGWLHTGDLGRIDEHGNLHYLGRKKDLIVTAAGMNVHPEDVERVLLAQPEIRDAAVVSKEVASRSTVHAVLVVAQPSRAVCSEIITRVNSQLESHQRIADYSIWPRASLPRTVSTQKLQRSAIADWVNGAPKFTAPAKAIPAWQQFLLDRGISPDRLQSGANINELGIDSLDQVELAMLLDEHGIAGPEQRPAEHRAFTEPDWPRGRIPQALRALFRPLILFPLLRWYVRIDAKGAENLAGVKGPVIFVANHQSYMDVPVILRALPRHFRAALAPAMSPSNFPTSTRLNLTRLCFNGFLLSPDPSAVQSALQHAGRLVETGYSILIFPEGVRTPDGKIHAFRPGAGLMAERLGVPVIPVRIEGLYEVWPAHQRQPGKGKVRVTIGKPERVSVEEFVTRSEKWFREN